MTLPLPPAALAAAEDDEITEAPEGRLLTRLHRYRERNRALVKQVKAAALKAHEKRCKINDSFAAESCGLVPIPESAPYTGRFRRAM